MFTQHSVHLKMLNFYGFWLFIYLTNAFYECMLENKMLLSLCQLQKCEFVKIVNISSLYAGKSMQCFFRHRHLLAWHAEKSVFSHYNRPCVYTKLKKIIKSVFSPLLLYKLSLKPKLDTITEYFANFYQCDGKSLCENTQ